MKIKEAQLHTNKFVYNKGENCLKEQQLGIKDVFPEEYILIYFSEDISHMYNQYIRDLVSIPITKNREVNWDDEQVVTLHEDFEIIEGKCSKHGCGNPACMFECLNPNPSATPTDQHSFHKSKIEGLIKDMNKSFFPYSATDSELSERREQLVHFFETTTPPPESVIKEFTVNTKCISKENLEREITETKAEIERYKKKANKAKEEPVTHLYEYIIFAYKIELALLKKLDKKYFKTEQA